MELKVEVTYKPKGSVMVTAYGAIDSTTYLDFIREYEKVLENPVTTFILNMEGVTYISSIGVSTIIKIKRAVEKNKGSFVIINLQPQIKAVFDIVQALPAECVFGSIEEADAYLGQIQRKALEKQKESY
ncbi:MAG: STAS domain-containing protein [Candidatus Omnitrophica bacterium]|nr:STAS domain-containing protein [Candidatus Omnitrophota bacterium]